MTSRVCGWCRGAIAATARRDSKFCCKSCRQASHRFGAGRVGLHRGGDGRPMRLAYADPPYPRRTTCRSRLVEQLVDGFPDGWALSTSAEALPAVLALCPPTVRVAAWVRGERPTVSYRPLSAWEPVIYFGGRALRSPVDARRVDALVHVSRPRTTDPARVIGAKPAAFCWWLFALLGAQPGDELVDLFPGSGGVARAWSYVSAADPHDASDQYSSDASRPTADTTRRVGLEPDTTTGDVAQVLRDVSACAGETRRVQVDASLAVSA